MDMLLKEGESARNSERMIDDQASHVFCRENNGLRMGILLLLLFLFRNESKEKEGGTKAE